MPKRRRPHAVCLAEAGATFNAARRIGVVAGLLMLVTEASAWGAPREHAVVHLSYTREVGAEQCPDEASLREAVLARLGYDPFDDEAPRVLRARVRRSPHAVGGSLVAHIELRDATGAVQGERNLQGAGSDCTELATAMAIAISLGIDPLSATEPRAPTPPPPAAAPVASNPPVEHAESSEHDPPARAEPPPPAPPSPPLHARFGIGGMLSWGISPAVPSVGGAVDAGLRRGAWSIDLEGAGSWAPTATDAALGVGVKSSLALASVAPCLHISWGVGCVLGGVGSWSATGVVRSPESGNALFADAGVRLGVEVPIARRFFAQFHADGLATLTHVAYHLDGQTAWNSPPLSASLGLGAGFEL